MDSIIGGALIQGGSSLLGGLLGMSGAQQANAQSADNARNMMEFQQFMSSTAHRREVDDLKAAGLNPILSVNAGASTPQGAMAPVQNTMEQLSGAFSTAAKDAMLFKAQMEKQKEEIALMKAQQEKTKNETRALETDATKGDWIKRIFGDVDKKVDKLQNVTKSTAKQIQGPTTLPKNQDFMGRVKPEMYRLR